MEPILENVIKEEAVEEDVTEKTVTDTQIEAETPAETPAEAQAQAQAETDTSTLGKLNTDPSSLKDNPNSLKRQKKKAVKHLVGMVSIFNPDWSLWEYNAVQ